MKREPKQEYEKLSDEGKGSRAKKYRKYCVGNSENISHEALIALYGAREAFAIREEARK